MRGLDPRIHVDQPTRLHRHVVDGGTSPAMTCKERAELSRGATRD